MDEYGDLTISLSSSVLMNQNFFLSVVEISFPQSL
jgi:hypothetical protein